MAEHRYTSSLICLFSALAYAVIPVGCIATEGWSWEALLAIPALIPAAICADGAVFFWPRRDSYGLES